jgi:hypothetical protein
MGILQAYLPDIENVTIKFFYKKAEKYFNTR